MAPLLKQGSKVFIVINPVAGLSNPQMLKKLCEQRFHALGCETSFHFTEKGEDLSLIVQNAIKLGVDLVVAVGGDGTIAGVASGLLNSAVPLGIVPSGTWNAIARHLFIPASPGRALDLITGKHSYKKMDMITVGNTIHAMNMGVGFSAQMNSNADRTKKRRFGVWTYLKHFLKLIFGLETLRYSIQADGETYRGRAAEILVANYGIAGLHILDDRLNIHPDDGKVDILILRARNLFDFPVLLWQMFISREKRTPKYRQFMAKKKVTITTKPVSLVQADGEIVGETPVNVTILPRAIQVIAPLPASMPISIDGLKNLRDAVPEPLRRGWLHRHDSRKRHKAP